MTVNVFPFYLYANALSLASFQTSNITVNKYVSPGGISDLQSTISSLPNLDYFLEYKENLIEISNTYALWASSGLPDNSDTILSVYAFNLSNLSNSLNVQYIEFSASYEENFTEEQVNFILYGKLQSN